MGRVRKCFDMDFYNSASLCDDQDKLIRFKIEPIICGAKNPRVGGRGPLALLQSEEHLIRSRRFSSPALTREYPEIADVPYKKSITMGNEGSESDSPGVRAFGLSVSQCSSNSLDS